MMLIPPKNCKCSHAIASAAIPDGVRCCQLIGCCCGEMAKVATCGALLEVQFGNSGTMHSLKCTAHDLESGWHVAPHGSRWKTHPGRGVKTVNLGRATTTAAYLRAGDKILEVYENGTFRIERDFGDVVAQDFQPQGLGNERTNDMGGNAHTAEATATATTDADGQPEVTATATAPESAEDQSPTEASTDDTSTDAAPAESTNSE